jgi:hypothetical protein
LSANRVQRYFLSGSVNAENYRQIENIGLFFKTEVAWITVIKEGILEAVPKLEFLEQLLWI